jgi:hypothetical protein
MELSASLLVAFFTNQWKKKNQKEGTKMHAKLQCLMGQWPYELKGHTRHIAHQHGEDMEYGSMYRGMLNLDGKHR